MKKEDYGKISIETIAKQGHVNVIAELDDFIVSKKPAATGEYSFDFKHPHIVEGIAFAFCIRGTAKVKINLTAYDVAENSVLIIMPNYIIQIVAQSADLQIEFLFFSFDFISTIRFTTEIGHVAKTIEQQACLHVDEIAFGELLSVHGLIVKQYQKQIAYREEVVKNLLYALVYQILQLYAINKAKGQDSRLNHKEEVYVKFMTLLFTHYKTERSVQFYADKLYLSPKYFSKVIKEANGRSVPEWIDEMVVMAAKALLKSSDLTVAQIANELNFANPSFFGTYFRKRVGLTPQQYRQK
ncbi:helix-turn-helix domain-containing protein [Parapedobacter koreensis]|uniref:AraC-type DNA-binding protein n=1 Tax=Parapedobacter koreensis TaxID=332977 RepID=A0A1H7SWX8_9SPHI|nr:helix-turn-helix domain-containing protein [Parapedobacter koreensis]SEL76037.1 AraC-type DNA-binding protein [Parapedobacter koreensis]